MSTVVDNDASTVEVFALDRLRMGDRTTLILALQGIAAERQVWNRDEVSGTLRNPSGEYDSINPRFGVLRSLSDDVTLYGNGSRLYEPPTTFQLEDEVAHGGATLDAMKGSVIEVGTR